MVTPPNSQEEVKLEPAAHLDPGPKGYNIYGTTGHSMHLVRKELLDTKETARRLELLKNEAVEKKKDGQLQCQQLLVHCRQLLVRFKAGKLLPRYLNVIHPMEAERGVSIGTDRTPYVTPLGDAHLPLVRTAYERAVQELLACEEKELAAQAANELGDIMLLSNNIQ